MALIVRGGKVHYPPQYSTNSAFSGPVGVAVSISGGFNGRTVSVLKALLCFFPFVFPPVVVIRLCPLPPGL